MLMLLLAGMAFWGADQGLALFQQGLGSKLAQAGPRTIELSDFDRSVERLLRNANQNTTEPVSKAELVTNGTIDRMFDVEASRIGALGYAQKIGLQASDAAVLSEIEKIEGFKNPLTGKLDRQRYVELLRQNLYSEAEFERSVSDDLVLTQLRNAASGAVHPVRLLAGLEARYAGEQRDVSWFVLDTKGAPKAVPPTDADIQAYYTQNLEALKNPERRIIDLISISSDDYVHQIEVTEQEVATIYETSKTTRFAGPDTRTFVELVFADKAKAEAGFGQLAVGKDASEIQGALSNETRTGAATSIADMNLREAMFSEGKQAGALYGPRETENGWLIARLMSVQPGAVPPLEEVADTIRNELARERANALVYEKIEAINQAINEGQSAAQIAATAGAPLMSFQAIDKDGFTATGTALTAMTTIEGALADAFALKQGETGSVLALPGGGSAIVSVRKIVPASTPAIETLKSELAAIILEERRQKSLSDFADGYAKQIKAGTLSLEAAAKQAGMSPEVNAMTLTRLNFQSSGLPQEVVPKIFSAAPSEVISLPNRTGEAYLVVWLRNIAQPEGADLETLTNESIGNLGAALGSDLQSALDSELTSALKVRRNERSFASYKARNAQEE